MTFKLVQKSTNAALAKFHIVNAAGTICGSINVKPSEISDLQKCWRDSAPVSPAAGAAGKQTAAVAALSNALRRGPRMNKEAILRGR